MQDVLEGHENGAFLDVVVFEEVKIQQSNLELGDGELSPLLEDLNDQHESVDDYDISESLVFVEHFGDVFDLARIEESVDEQQIHCLFGEIALELLQDELGDEENFVFFFLQQNAVRRLELPHVFRKLTVFLRVVLHEKTAISLATQFHVIIHHFVSLNEGFVVELLQFPLTVQDDCSLGLLQLFGHFHIDQRGSHVAPTQGFHQSVAFLCVVVVQEIGGLSLRLEERVNHQDSLGKRTGKSLQHYTFPALRIISVKLIINSARTASDRSDKFGTSGCHLSCF